jgi:hypothetical protein
LGGEGGVSVCIRELRRWAPVKVDLADDAQFESNIGLLVASGGRGGGRDITDAARKRVGGRVLVGVTSVVAARGTPWRGEDMRRRREPLTCTRMDGLGVEGGEASWGGKDSDGLM